MCRSGDVLVSHEISQTFASKLMARKGHVIHWENECDSLSEEVEDALEDPIKPFFGAKRLKLESQSWVDKYTPKDSSGVCINPQKLKEVRQALENMISGGSNCRLLVLSGPSGSSKSTLVKCLAKELLPQQTRSLDKLIEYFDSMVEDGPLPTQFRDFLTSCKYHVGSNLALVLLEELPNVFHTQTLLNFREAIKNWVSTDFGTPLPPLVLCLTEIDSISGHDEGQSYNINNTLNVETLLGREILQIANYDNRITRIKFNSLARSFVTRTINSIAKAEGLMSYLKQNRALAQSIYESGDIRSLINNFEFWSRSNNKLVGFHPTRESQITLFHAIGKIIFASSHLSNADEQFCVDYNSVKAVADNYYNNQLLRLGLLENYTIYNGLQYDLSIAANITDKLSICDNFDIVPGFNEYGFLSTRTELRKAKASRPFSMKFPRHFLMLKERNKVFKCLQSYRRYIKQLQISMDDANLIDGFLVPKVWNSFLYKMKHDPLKERYDRIGGSFKKMYGGANPIAMETEEEEAEVHGIDQLAKDISDVIRKERDEKNWESDSEGLSDSIDDFSGEDDDFNDTLDERLMLMTQRNNLNSAVAENSSNGDFEDDELLDDPELDFLVSQGKL